MPVLPVAPSPSFLTTDVRLPVESSDELAKEVALPAPTQVRPIKALDSNNSSDPELLERCDCTVEQLLMTLGRVTAGPASLRQAALDTAALWALARYSWAFDTNMASGADIVLDAATDAVWRHNRTALSENLGIAAACWLTESYLLGQAPVVGIADVDNAIHILEEIGAVTGPAGLTGPRPDYLYFLMNSTGVYQAIAIECKGTAPRGSKSPRRQHLTDQLRDGVRQAVSWTVPGCLNEQFVFGSVLRDLRWTVHCLEAVPSTPTGGGLRGITAASLVNAGAARLLTYAGMYPAAYLLLREPAGVLDLELARMRTREVASLTVVGHSMFATSPVGVVEIFHGVEQQTLAAIAGPVDGRGERMAAAQQAYHQDRFTTGQSDLPIAPALRLELGPDTLGLAARDGCIQLIKRVAVGE